MDDLISRQAAVDAMMRLQTEDIEAYGASIPEGFDGDRAVAELKALPSAQPDVPDTNVGDMISRQGVLRLLNAVPSEEFATKAMLISGVNALPPAQLGWIPVTEKLPENEQDVFVTVEVRPYGRKPFRRVVKAFYTDGRHTDADSAYSWDEFPDPQYDDDDNMIIPEGWWESSDYLEQQGMIDDFVIAWCEPLKPWEGEGHE